MTTEGVTRGATLLGEPLPVELMNTVTMDRGRTYDALDSDAGATAWLRAVADRFRTEAGIDAGELDEDAVRPVAATLRALRDALRRLASEATRDPRPPATAAEFARPEAISTLNALAQAWTELVWPADGPPSRVYRGSGTAPDLAVRLIAHQAVDLFAGPDLERLHPCPAPNCPLFFVKNHARREWCSPVCGNRARVARHYHRHHAALLPGLRGRQLPADAGLPADGARMSPVLDRRGEPR
ncbi:ABATE domain-containing protein [Streptomyces sp. GESEQ-35]|uniref:CGNR zinc finger domain-containing protein n=1 Tax=Streptomyces sp. GESEQ-35 TaxID=2812657 RepID=UPI001FF5BCC2|nr:ABATE domain-containing protein [Streptomyces sp. GESEQ-35]